MNLIALFDELLPLFFRERLSVPEAERWAAERGVDVTFEANHLFGLSDPPDGTRPRGEAAQEVFAVAFENLTCDDRIFRARYGDPVVHMDAPHAWERMFPLPTSPGSPIRCDLFLSGREGSGRLWLRRGPKLASDDQRPLNVSTAPTAHWLEEPEFSAPGDGLLVHAPPGVGWVCTGHRDPRSAPPAAWITCRRASTAERFVMQVKVYEVSAAEVVAAEVLAREVAHPQHERTFRSLRYHVTHATSVLGLPGFEVGFDAVHPSGALVRRLERTVAFERSVVVLSAEGAPEDFDLHRRTAERWLACARLAALKESVSVSIPGFASAPPRAEPSWLTYEAFITEGPAQNTVARVEIGPDLGVTATATIEGKRQVWNAKAPAAVRARIDAALAGTRFPFDAKAATDKVPEGAQRRLTACSSRHHASRIIAIGGAPLTQRYADVIESFDALLREATAGQVSPRTSAPPTTERAVPLQAPAPDTSQTPLTPALIAGNLDKLGGDVDAEYARRKPEQARAQAANITSILRAYGHLTERAELERLLAFGENFYRWGFHAEGVDYWKEACEITLRLAGLDSPEMDRALTMMGASQVLAGQLGVETSSLGEVLARLIVRFGHDHPFTRSVEKHVGSEVSANVAARVSAPLVSQVQPVAPVVPPELDARSDGALGDARVP